MPNRFGSCLSYMYDHPRYGVPGVTVMYFSKSPTVVYAPHENFLDRSLLLDIVHPAVRLAARSVRATMPPEAP
jgi:hypothetical protein